MRAVYRHAGRGLVVCCAVAWMVIAGCSKAGGPRKPTPVSTMPPRTFELAGFLASRPTPVDSPAVAHLLAARDLSSRFELPPPPPTTLFVPPDGFRVAAVAPRGDRIALVRELDPDTTEVLLHDRARGETRLLLPLDRDGRFLPQRFSADGKRLFLFSDEGDDTLQLEILDPDTGARSRRARPGCAALRLDVSPDGSRRRPAVELPRRRRVGPVRCHHRRGARATPFAAGHTAGARAARRKIGRRAL